MTFNSTYEVDKLAKCLFDTSELMKWDKTLDKNEIDPIHEGRKSFGI